MPALLIGVRKDHPDIDPAEYIVSLHTKTTCYSFTTAYNKRTRKWHLREETLDLNSDQHQGWCDYLAKKQVIAQIPEASVNSVTMAFRGVEDAYEELIVRESQFTVFRFLYLLVDAGIITEKDVKQVEPKIERRRGGMRDFDWKS
ncbi:uncharacterized protein BDV14DRAFT_198506 [Aspergillus stella-maris]|uniref:uncharacterized protein n=1 Tax=Aspergillus stella-maris TaxID=1810926 RepID=UPI003CCDF29A